MPGNPFSKIRWRHRLTGIAVIDGGVADDFGVESLVVSNEEQHENAAVGHVSGRYGTADSACNGCVF